MISIFDDASSLKLRLPFLTWSAALDNAITGVTKTLLIIKPMTKLDNIPTRRIIKLVKMLSIIPLKGPNASSIVR